MSIAQRLKQARQARGYTQDALASAIGVSRGVITNIEYDKADPQSLVIRAISHELHINEDWLLSGEGSMDTASDQEKSAYLLTEIYNLAKELSEEEQDYILDMIKAYQKHRVRLGAVQTEQPSK